MNDNSDDGKKSKRPVPTWLPVSVFIGTSLAIAIPLLMVRKAKGTALQTALRNPSSAPPRRAPQPLASSTTTESTPSAHLRLRRPTTANPNPTFTVSSSHHFADSPSTMQLLSAVSKTNLNTALLAGKALFIATCLVGVGAYGLVYSIQTFMGVDNVPDFARRMRYWTNKHMSGVISRIYRAPENSEERRMAYDPAPPGADKDWTWEEAEKRLKLAYDQGGFSLWAQVALRELEAEARMERAKRQYEIDAEARRA